MGLGPPLCRDCLERDGVRAGIFKTDGVEWCLRCKRVGQDDDTYFGEWELPSGVDASVYIASPNDYKTPKRR